jgi:virulence-associated protein VapD
MAKRENRKSINFDLITLRLYEVFGESGTGKAYTGIKRFMLRHGFEHKQYSGYVSSKRMSYVDTYDLIRDMRHQLPWLARCIQKLDITDYMAESDALEFVINERVDVGDNSVDDIGL